MAKPNLCAIYDEFNAFDQAPLTHDVQGFLKRLYHLFYYHEQGWQVMDSRTLMETQRMFARVKGIRDYNMRLLEREANAYLEASGL